MTIEQSENSNVPKDNAVERVDVALGYEVNGQHINMRLVDVELLFIDLEKYNYQFSMGAMIGRALGKMMYLEEESRVIDPAFREEETSQQANAFFLSATHKDTLENLGLSIEPIDGGATIAFNGESASSGQIRFNINNQENLTAFLAAIETPHLETTGIKGNLETLAGILTRQISDHYNFSDMVLTDEMFQLFGSMEQIIGEYKRLCLDQTVAELEVYLTHGKQGDLREYIFAERAGLFKEPGFNFGPADWQGDSTPESLRFRWKTAIRIVQLAKDNPKATELFIQLTNHLNMCVGVALSKLERLDFLNTEQKAESEQVLRQAKSSLEAITG